MSDRFVLRPARGLLVAAATALFAVACSDTPGPESLATGPLRHVDDAALFLTPEPAQARAIDPSKTTLKPLLTVGDILPGSGLPWEPIPDGLGAYMNPLGDIIVFANHELTASPITSSDGGAPFQWAKVSRLTLDPKSVSIKSGFYVEDGSGQYVRFCSAAYVDIYEGFPSGLFMAGEENNPTGHGSTVLGVTRERVKTNLPHLGSYSHENQIALPFGAYNEIVTFGTDDTQGASELYMYVAANQAAFIGGTGKLYVFKSDARTAARKNYHSGNLTIGGSVAGYWVEVVDPADLGTPVLSRFANLQRKVDALGAFPFVRLEDADYDRRAFNAVTGQIVPGRKPAIYFVDTGNSATFGRVAGAVNADCGGVCDLAGSIYRVELDPVDPTGPAKLILVHRSTGINSGFASPDNIAMDSKGMMLQEDPAFSGFDGTRPPAIFYLTFENGGTTLARQVKVAEVTQETLIPGPAGKCVDATALCWETSGIISMEKWLGAGTWLFDVQAHTLPFVANGKHYGKEGGQLLFMKHTP